MTRSKQFSFDPTEFDGKRALVTGGAKGMGEAIVRRLAAGGATVATTARSPLPKSQAVALLVQADISTREGVDKVVREVLDRLGGVDILVNNVGGSSAPSGGGHTSLRLSGRIQSEHLEALKAQIRRNSTAIVLDLEDVTLVDLDAVRFLGGCEAEGIGLLHCPPYVRQWILRERA